MLAPDTKTLVYFFKGIGGIAQRLQSTPPREVGIPAVVLYELEVGIAKSHSPERRRSALGALLQLVRILTFRRRIGSVRHRRSRPSGGGRRRSALSIP